jgi:hypothetical protein
MAAAMREAPKKDGYPIRLQSVEPTPPSTPQWRERSRTQVIRLLRVFGHRGGMPDQTSNALSLRQADQARGDLYAIHDELEFPRQQRDATSVLGGHRF